MEKLKDMNLINLDTLILMVKDENREQLKKWGSQEVTPSEWMLFLTEEVGEVANAISEHQYRDGDPMFVVLESIQVATLALKIAEMYLEV